MDTLYINQGLQLQQFSALGGVLGVFIAGITATLLTMWIKSWKTKNKEDICIIEKLTETHVLVKDTRNDVRDIKIDISDMKKTQQDHEFRLTDLEKEHKLFSKNYTVAKDKTTKNKYLRILVVDNQQEVIDFMVSYFHEILPTKNGWDKYIFQVDGVTTYDEAVKKINSGNYNLGLFDVCLSKIDPRDGFLLAKHSLRLGLENFLVYSADKNLKNIPIEFAEKFLIKPGTQEDWLSFENKIKEMV